MYSVVTCLAATQGCAKCAVAHCLCEEVAVWDFQCAQFRSCQWPCHGTRYGRVVVLTAALYLELAIQHKFSGAGTVATFVLFIVLCQSQIAQ